MEKGNKTKKLHFFNGEEKREREKNKAFQNTHVERSTWLFKKKEGTNKVAVTVFYTEVLGAHISRHRQISFEVIRFLKKGLRKLRTTPKTNKPISIPRIDFYFSLNVIHER